MLEEIKKTVESVNESVKKLDNTELALANAFIEGMLAKGRTENKQKPAQ